RADKIRLYGHLRRYKKIVKKTYIIYYQLNIIKLGNFKLIFGVAFFSLTLKKCNTTMKLIWIKCILANISSDGSNNKWCRVYFL
ncbi:hypothetical protein, partial [Eubacterium ventriosum]|uniref:hypothetical protein n=1 Tax=Eubacterium ventriosum TaxID=39496 RepID=UPI001A9AAD32